MKKLALIMILALTGCVVAPAGPQPVYYGPTYYGPYYDPAIYIGPGFYYGGCCWHRGYYHGGYHGGYGVHR